MRAKELIDDPVLEDELAEAVLILAAQMCKVREAKENGNGSDRLLTLDEAAAKLNVSTGWLYHKSRRLPFVVRTGRKLGFSDRGIDEYIRQKQGKGICE
jgi:predicted DNA-binding transcriptional regulator AlpA